MLLVNSRNGLISLYAPLPVADLTGWGVESVPAESADSPPYWFDHSAQRGGEIRFPYWFPVVLTSVLAAAFAARPPYRFSLRTLLVATTIVAVVMGLIAYLARR
jgi:hypothetical protein